ncbi:intein/RHS repeat-associated protein [Kribbella sp. VKM Ac-2527]|uniref:Intein/RHS repeat-associated protein n=1 Tax=Kribbella caucasensis TaxID=2512215 RepID=A0A4V3C948_9ACTN|nr:polymorphic toxin-type HINT domain-containing protein [Kribbella sp. VKM Ac-2527]TDO44048.1 intein/RHS repeat-associated protein [Kribbella sp. VKM Ac-2527]
MTINQLAPLKDQFYDYTWDVRGLLGSVKTGETASDPAAKTTSYTYNNLGQRATETKGNQNKVTFSWFDNGLMTSSREVKPNGTSLVAEHIMGYDLDGNRISDTAKVLNSDTKAIDPSTATYTYEPRGRVTAVTRTGAGAGNESYTYTATSNISSQTIAGVATSFVYDRNRLQKATSGTSSFYNYDPFGRLDTISSGGAVTGRYVYDGFDRVVEQRTITGAVTKTTKSTYDAWDRVASKTDAAGKTSAMSYLGLSSQLPAELDTATNKPTEAYTFDAYGQRLTQTTTKTDGTSEDAWYGYNPHSDVETLTTSTGDTESTYGYTAFGKDRAGAMSGADKPGVSTEPYNVYRFNGKRWDAASGDYDMGFRTYNPGLNRFTSRDSYNGALADLNLGTDPWNINRYAFAGGNPITRIELDGHINESLTAGGGRAPAAVSVTVGSRDVTADDPNEFKAAYDATKAKLIGDGGGQGHESIIGCNDEETWKVEAGQATTCSWSDTQFSNMFAEELCRQSGIRCGPYTPSGAGGAGLGHDGGGVRLSGGPEAPTGSRAAAGGYCSFSGETKVEMGDGSRKPISQVKLGDEVLATDPETGERGPRKVTHLWVHTDKLLQLEVDGGFLTTTEDHPFWNATDGKFERADQLDSGDQLLADDGQLVRVIGVRTGSQRVATAYNLTVDDIHTYYVLAGTTPVLVHNANCPHSNSIGAAAQARAEQILGKFYPGNKMQVQFNIWTPHGVRKVDIAGENSRGGFDLYEIKANGSNYPSRERVKDQWIEQELGWKTHVLRFDETCQCYSE